jgi:hypothetical protein
MEELSVTEINTLIEAVDAWTTASQTSSMLAGLFMGALISRSSENGTVEGKSFVDKFTDGEDQKTENRKEQAIPLKAKLMQMRTIAEAREVAKEMVG